MDVVEYLLNMGTDALKLDSKRQTPTFWAEKDGFVEVDRALEEAENLQCERANTSMEAGMKRRRIARNGRTSLGYLVLF